MGTPSSSSRYSSACSGTSDWTKSVLCLGIEAGANPVGHVVEGVADDARPCRRSRSSARASRRRSRSSRTRPAARTQFWSAPTRWPRCSWPVGRMPETTRCRSVTAANDRTKRCSGPHDGARARPVSISAYRMQEAVGPHAIDQRGATRRGSSPPSTLPPSSGGIGSMLKTASSTLSTTTQRTQRRRAGCPRAAPSAAGASRQQPPRPATASTQVAGRPGRGDEHVVAPRVPQVPDVHRHRLGPADERHAREHGDQREQHACRSGPRARPGSATRRPSSRAVGIAQPVGRPGVRRLVDRQRETSTDDEGDEDHAAKSMARPRAATRYTDPARWRRSARRRRRPPSRRRRPSAPRGWRGGRRPGCRTLVSSVLRRRGPDARHVVELRPQVAHGARLAVERDGEAVRLVADPLQQEQGRARRGRAPAARSWSRVKTSSSFLARPTATRFASPSALERGVGGGQLPLAAVDQRSGRGTARPPRAAAR